MLNVQHKKNVIKQQGKGQPEVSLTVFEPTNDMAFMSSSSQILLTIFCQITYVRIF